MRPKALLYRLGEETETGRALRAVLRERKILTLTVEAGQLAETAGKLASSNAAAGADGAAEAGAYEGAAAPETEFLLLCGLGDKQLDRLLADLRRAGVKVPYKAVLTEHNRDWPLGKLIAEVAREHELLKRSQ